MALPTQAAQAHAAVVRVGGHGLDVRDGVDGLQPHPAVGDEASIGRFHDDVEILAEAGGGLHELPIPDAVLGGFVSVTEPPPEQAIHLVQVVVLGQGLEAEAGGEGDGRERVWDGEGGGV